MQRRDFMLTAAAVGGLAIAGCTGTGPLLTESALEKRRRKIDTQFYVTLERLYMAVPDARELLAKARGVLVFPTVIAVGAATEEQYGEGVLRVANTMVRYYSVTSTSIGLQTGLLAGLETEAQSKAIILFFMTQDALDDFRNNENWFAGVDAPVRLIKTAANGKLDPRSITAPILAFILDGNRLVTNLTLDGTKISRLDI